MPSTFDTRLKRYLTIHKIPIGPNQLDPNVFYTNDFNNEPILFPSIHSQICKDIEALLGNHPHLIKKFYLTGPALEPGNKNNSGDLKVTLFVNKSLLDSDNLLLELLLDTAKKLSNKLAVGTTRQIKYTITVRDLNLDEYTGVYDLYQNKWIKIPNGITK